MACLEAERLEVVIIDKLGRCVYCGEEVTSENGYQSGYISSWDMEYCHGSFHNKGMCKEME